MVRKQKLNHLTAQQIFENRAEIAGVTGGRHNIKLQKHAKALARDITNLRTKFSLSDCLQESDEIAVFFFGIRGRIKPEYLWSSVNSKYFNDREDTTTWKIHDFLFTKTAKGDFPKFFNRGNRVMQPPLRTSRVHVDFLKKDLLMAPNRQSIVTHGTAWKNFVVELSVAVMTGFTRGGELANLLAAELLYGGSSNTEGRIRDLINPKLITQTMGNTTQGFFDALQNAMKSEVGVTSTAQETYYPFCYATNHEAAQMRQLGLKPYETNNKVIDIGYVTKAYPKIQKYAQKLLYDAPNLKDDESYSREQKNAILSRFKGASRALEKMYSEVFRSAYLDSRLNIDWEVKSYDYKFPRATCSRHEVNSRQYRFCFALPPVCKFHPIADRFTATCDCFMGQHFFAAYEWFKILEDRKGRFNLDLISGDDIFRVHQLWLKWLLESDMKSKVAARPAVSLPTELERLRIGIGELEAQIEKQNEQIKQLEGTLQEKDKSTDQLECRLKQEISTLEERLRTEKEALNAVTSEATKYKERYNEILAGNISTVMEKVQVWNREDAEASRKKTETAETASSADAVLE